jgi:hypothetical protein
MAGSRIGMPTRVAVAELELRGDVFVDDWFLVATIRYAPLGFTLRRKAIPGYIYDEIQLGLGVGKRVSLGSARVDIALAPAIVIMTEEGDLPDGTGGTAFGARLNASARIAFGQARFRPALVLDAEIAPLVLLSPVRVDPGLPPLPTWTFGLRGGVVGNLL